VSTTFLLQLALPLSFPQRREPPPPSPPLPHTCTLFPYLPAQPLHAGTSFHTQSPELFPSPAAGLTATTAALLTRLPTHVHYALTAANSAELTRLWPTDRARTHFNSISSRPGSMWLDAVPYAPSLRLDDQSFQTQTASAWECTRSPPLARAGRAPAATQSRTTTSRTP
jgi:hypothetical protein